MLRLWGLVLLGNIIGGVAFSAFAASLLPKLGAADADAFGKIAHDLVSHSWWIMFLSAVMAGWLMGLLSWLVTASRESMSQIVCVWLTTSIIGYAGLHHCIAGTVEVLTGVFLHHGATLGDYLTFMSAAVPGNAVGGSVFVALLKWGHIQAVDS